MDEVTGFHDVPGHWACTKTCLGLNLSSPSLSFPVYKMHVIILASQAACEEMYVKLLAQGSSPISSRY